jgi:hypothetical protein
MKSKPLIILLATLATFTVILTIRRQQTKPVSLTSDYSQKIAHLDKNDLSIIKVDDLDLTQPQIDTQKVNQLLDTLLPADPQTVQLISEKSLNHQETKVQLNDTIIWVGERNYQDWYVRFDNQEQIYLLSASTGAFLSFEESFWLTDSDVFAD